MGLSGRRQLSDGYAALFGRFTASKETDPDANEVLVGREGQRAYLIDLLISMGRQGAYLVTGRRGAGKTSFVRHCIREYRLSVYKRFLRNSVGRGIIDRLALLTVWSMILLTALLVSECLQLLAPLTYSSEGKISVLAWLALAPLGAPLLYPAYFSRAILTSFFKLSTAWKLPAIRPRRNHRKETTPRLHQSHGPGITSALIVVMFAVFAWFWGPFGAPAVGLSRLIVVFSLTYASVSALSFKTESHRLATNVILLLIRTLIALFLLMYLLKGPGRATSPSIEVLDSLGLSFFYLGIGHLLRFWHQYRLAHSEHSNMRVISESLLRGGSWYRSAGLLFGLGGMILYLYNHTPSITIESLYQMIPILLGLTLSLAGISIGSTVKGSNSGAFLPRPDAALFCKAALCVVLSLQLVHPLLKNAPSQFFRELELMVSTWHPVDFTMDESTTIRHAVSLAQVRARPKPPARTSPQSVLDNEPNLLFSRRKEELSWIALVLLALMIIYFLEYEWIIRPFLSQREDPALDVSNARPPWEDKSPWPISTRDRKRFYRALAECTLPWAVYRSWLPVLPVSVNLGFDRLDHRRVVQAMLVGLRDLYYKSFLAWNCSLANIARLAGIIALLVFVTLTGKAWLSLESPPPSKYFHRELATAVISPVFDLPTAILREHKRLAKDLGTYSGPCAYILHHPELTRSGVLPLICRVGGDTGFYLATLDLIPPGLGSVSQPTVVDRSRHLLLYEFLPYSPYPVILPTGSAPLTMTPVIPHGIYFCTYHLLLLIVLFLAGRAVTTRLPIFPYRQNLKRIDDVLDSLSATTRVTLRKNLWKPARWVYGFLVDEKESETEREPVDPRTIELAFLQILHDLQRTTIPLPGIGAVGISLPVPEVTFIFDELDKLGTRVEPEESSLPPLREQLEILHAERRRSMALLALLSDLKNLLSSAPARFIFVGGRNLHDEWLADQTSRQPLLTNIFNAEVYLPSLLTDHSRLTGAALTDRVSEFLLTQVQRANLLYQRSSRKRFRPSFGLPSQPVTEEDFLQDTPSHGYELRLLKIRKIRDGSRVEPKTHVEFSRDFIATLAYRSMGNPKRLKELLATFVRPVGRVMTSDTTRWSEFPCRHVLKFGAVEIFRIQLLAEVFRFLADRNEDRLLARDDKLITSLFYLNDFLFKFHRRAFSWSNLERVDELAHIHRAPDLRNVLEELVNSYSERILHRVLNGMYSFRFRSEYAAEIAYLSRQSPEEMAAFNFTLDESQSLKAFYSESLRSSSATNPSMVAGLGELYEFDQEYETARKNYRAAISLLDSEIESYYSPPTEPTSNLREDTTARLAYGSVQSILSSVPEGFDYARMFVSWGAARLRLMLQIGMTYEHSRNYESAETEYRSARALARVLLRAYVDRQGRSKDPYLDQDRPDKRKPNTRLEILKHLNIIFQPIFAEAWVFEKTGGGIDTSLSLVEKSLWEVRAMLPFVRQPKLKLSKNPANVRGSNFGLIMSQLHNKAGDLYFFKGRQAPARGDDAPPTEKESVTGTEGYLLQSHYHYAVSLHEIRRYLIHRRRSSAYKFCISGDRVPTFLPGEWPDFIYRAAAGDLNDMAEATLARISLGSLFGRLANPDTSQDRPIAQACSVEEFTAACVEWLEDVNENRLNCREQFIDLGRLKHRVGSLDDWLGRWGKRKDFCKATKRIIVFSAPHEPEERLMMSLLLGYVGAELLHLGGYAEDSSRELLKLVDVVCFFLWSRRYYGFVTTCLSDLKMKARTRAPAEANSEPRGTAGDNEIGSSFERLFWADLTDFAIGCLQKSLARSQASRRSQDSRSYRETSRTAICSLVLAARDLLDLCSRRGQVRSLLGDLSGSCPISPGSDALVPSTREILKGSLDTDYYPIINRLNVLKVLVDDSILGASAKDLGEIIGYSDELNYLNSQFSSPFHFTPMKSGSTLALVLILAALRAELNRLPPEQARLEPIGVLAARELRASIEMISMKRAYYESISGLYYLYDDFNDREVHFNQALQMAGCELSQALLAAVGFIRESY